MFYNDITHLFFGKMNNSGLLNSNIKPEKLEKTGAFELPTLYPEINTVHT